MKGKGCMWSIVSNRPKAWSRFLKVPDLEWSLTDFNNWFRFWDGVFAFSLIVEQKWEVKARNGRLTLITKRLHIRRREDVDLPISKWRHTVSATNSGGSGLVSELQKIERRNHGGWVADRRAKQRVGLDENDLYFWDNWKLVQTYFVLLHVSYLNFIEIFIHVVQQIKSII